jgi:hypothetical protein
MTHLKYMPVFGGLFVLLCCCLIEQSARAQESNTTFQWPKGTLKAYDTLGLAPKARPYSLEPEIELNMPHKEARQLIGLLPRDYQSTPLRNLVISALIARIDGASITRSDNVAQGRDLLTIRLKTLNAMGAHKHAFRLYTAMENDVAHPQLLKAAIHTQLGLGRYALACLEAKAGLDNLNTQTNAAADPDAPFWRQMQQLCRPVIGQPLVSAKNQQQANHSPKSVQWDKEVGRPSAWEELSDYSIPEMAFIMREYKQHLARLKGSPDDLSPAKLAMLSHITEVPLKLKFEIMRVAGRHNLIRPGHWRQFLKKVQTRLEKGATAPGRDNLPKALRYLLALSDQYTAKQRGENIQPAEKTAQTFAKLQKHVPASAILAFESLLKTPSNGKPALKTRNAAMKIYLKANRFFKPDDWRIGLTPVNDAAQATPEDQALTQQYELLTLFALRDQVFSNLVSNYMTACSRQKACPLPEYAFIQDSRAFLDALNVGVAKAIVPVKIYENEKVLTYRSLYVIPSVSLRKRIRAINVKKGLGKAIFLSTLALHREEKDKFDPYLTASVLEKLSDAGMKRFGRDFAITYLIGTLEKKGV